MRRSGSWDAVPPVHRPTLGDSQKTRGAHFAESSSRGNSHSRSAPSGLADITAPKRAVTTTGTHDEDARGHEGAGAAHGSAPLHRSTIPVAAIDASGGGGDGEGRIMGGGGDKMGSGATGRGEVHSVPAVDVAVGPTHLIAWSAAVLEGTCDDVDERVAGKGSSIVDSLLHTVKHDNVLVPHVLDIPFALAAYGDCPLELVDVHLLVSGAERLAALMVAVVFRKAMETCAVVYLYGTVGLLALVTVVLRVAADTGFGIDSESHLALTTVHATKLAEWVAKKERWEPQSPDASIPIPPDKLELFRRSIDVIFEGHRSFGILDIKAVASAIFTGKHLVKDRETARRAVSLLHAISLGYHSLRDEDRTRFLMELAHAKMVWVAEGCLTPDVELLLDDSKEAINSWLLRVLRMIGVPLGRTTAPPDLLRTDHGSYTPPTPLTATRCSGD